jgi:hypothetical protein
MIGQRDGECYQELRSDRTTAVIEGDQLLCGSEFIRGAVVHATQMWHMHGPIANELAPTELRGAIHSIFDQT